MPIRKAPDHIPVLETTYRDRYPALSDLLRQGGIPGYAYYLMHAANISSAQHQGLSLVQGLPALEIHGPKGIASAFLMCLGEPIPGADPLNGVRKFAIDPQLDSATGLGPQPEPVREKQQRAASAA